MRRSPNPLKQSLLLSLTGCLLVALLIIPIRLSIATHQSPQPQAILTLGGGENREKFTAQFAQPYPHLPIWVSSGIKPPQAQPIFQAAGINPDRLHFDDRATDTLTNFTTLIADFKQNRIQHLYLITSEFHMPRAKAIATLVLGSQGIAFTPVSIPDPTKTQRQESFSHILRDCWRSLLWIGTGRTGASMTEAKHPAVQNWLTTVGWMLAFWVVLIGLWIKKILDRIKKPKRRRSSHRHSTRSSDRSEL
jgi:uncharacterized SAM-binding protein YcdF (DUF218 family)